MSGSSNETTFEATVVVSCSNTKGLFKDVTLRDTAKLLQSGKYKARLIMPLSGNPTIIIDEEE